MKFASFIKQFKLPSMLGIKLEGFTFRTADLLIPSYDGGTWNAVKTNCVLSASIPGKGDVTMVNPLSGANVNTNRETASLIFTYLLISWFWERNADILPDDSQELLSACREAIRDYVYSNITPKGIDVTAFFKFTD